MGMGAGDDLIGSKQVFGSTDQEKMVRVDPRCTAVYDGHVLIAIDRFVGWLKAAMDYSTMNIGPTCSPMGTLLVKIPVEGAKAGEPLTPEQFAEVMLVTSKMVGPAALSFAQLVSENFGLPDPDDWT